MAKYSIEEATLIDIGNAIRAKEESSTPIPVPELAGRIRALAQNQIETGTLTINGPAEAVDFVSCFATVMAGDSMESTAIDLSGMDSDSPKTIHNVVCGAGIFFGSSYIYNQGGDITSNDLERLAGDYGSPFYAFRFPDSLRTGSVTIEIY